MKSTIGAYYSAAGQDLRKSQETAQSTGYYGANASSKDTNVEENMWFQQETATALANL